MATRLRKAAETCFRYFCEMCRKETTWHFVTEDARMEYYKCECCNHTKGWAVR